MTTLDDPTTTPAADTIRDTLRAWALHFAARGWHVFPITPGAKKPPVLDRWETRASTDPDQITHWWRHIPYSIGIATGPSGLVVVDLDTAKPGDPVPERWAALGIGSGAGVLRALARQHATTITPTFATSTPSGGWHLYYTAPPGTQLRNTHGMLGWKIDTRAHGGYVVAPASPVPPSGYELVDDRDPVELPSWLTPRPQSQAAHGDLSVRSDGHDQPQWIRLRRRARRVPAGAHGTARAAQRGALPRRLRPGPAHRRRSARRRHRAGRTHHRSRVPRERRVRLHTPRGRPGHHRRTRGRGA
ncbi:MAG: bifunctional DNA primase/polymerase [Pseudonocardiaceae bacterium]